MRACSKHLKKGGVYLLFFACLVNHPAFGNNHPSYFIQSFSESYSEIAPIKQTLNNLKGPEISKGEVIYSRNHFEMGRNIFLPTYGLSIAFISRRNYFLNFTHDTARFIYKQENDLDTGKNDTYDIHLTANNLTANGLRIGLFSSVKNTFKYSIGLSLLRGTNMTTGSLQGYVDSRNERIDGQLVLNYQFTDDVFFGRESSTALGYGFALDTTLEWHCLSRLTLTLEAEDLVSFLEWHNQHDTQATASTDTTQQTAAGGRIINPVLSWQETHQRTQQHLPVNVNISQAYALTPYDTLVLAQKIKEDFVSYSFGYERIIATTHWGVHYDWVTQGLSLAVSKDRYSLELGLDHLNYAEAQTANLSFTVEI